MQYCSDDKTIFGHVFIIEFSNNVYWVFILLMFFIIPT